MKSSKEQSKLICASLAEFLGSFDKLLEGVTSIRQSNEVNLFTALNDESSLLPNVTDCYETASNVVMFALSESSPGEEWCSGTKKRFPDFSDRMPFYLSKFANQNLGRQVAQSIEAFFVLLNIDVDNKHQPLVKLEQTRITNEFKVVWDRMPDDQFFSNNDDQKEWFKMYRTAKLGDLNDVVILRQKHLLLLMMSKVLNWRMHSNLDELIECTGSLKKSVLDLREQLRERPFLGIVYEYEVVERNDNEVDLSTSPKKKRLFELAYMAKSNPTESDDMLCMIYPNEDADPSKLHVLRSDLNKQLQPLEIKIDRTHRIVRIRP